jgi:hypothetical protein
MEFKLLKQHIYNLENRMLQPEIRSSKEKMGELLSGDFFEFGSSGRVYSFREDSFQNDNPEPIVFNCEIKEFDIKILATDVVLATYKAIKHHETRENMRYSLRSTIWKSFNGQWKAVFHQGTPAT